MTPREIAPSETGTGQQPSLPPVHESWLPREHALHRPRHGHRQTLALVCAAVFFATPLVSLGLTRPNEFENRALAKFPDPSQGWGFFTQMSPWATDRLPFREDAIHLANAVSRSLFGEPPALGGGKYDSGPVQSDKQPVVPNSFPNVLEGKEGWLYIGAEVESHCKLAHPLDETFSRLRQLRDGVEASGRKFVLVVAPDKATMVPGRLPDDYPGKDCRSKVGDDFWHRVDGEDYMLDLRPELRAWANKLGAPIYGPQDAHWSDEGGVTMAQALAEKLRPGISTTWKVDAGADWQVAADIPPLIGETGQTKGRFYSIMPDGKRDQTRQVPTDYTMPLPLNTASGPGTYGFGVGMLSDSFTIRSLRYLAASFGDMTVLHHNSIQRDGGVAAAQMLANESVVVVEVAERTLVSGNFELTIPDVVAKIVGALSARPIR
jgi:alginate O-acetyltransferase complex protein AlgJ